MLRFILALALATFCATSVSAQDVPDTTSELFKLSESDYSVGALTKIFGGIVTYVVDGDEAALEAGSLVSSAVAILNVVILGIATLIGLYTILSVTADTASDGTALGRSTDTKYTFLRAGIAAIFLLPVKGGFALIQLLAIYLMVWGAGLADTTWKFVAEKTLSAESYVGPVNINTNDGWAMRGELAKATLGLVNGELCARHLRRLSTMYGANGGAHYEFNEGVSTTPVAFPRKYFEMYYQSDDGSHNSQDLCGNVKYSVAYSAGQLDNSFNSDELKSLSDKLSNIASNQIYGATKSALLNIVLPRATALARKIDSGSGDGFRNDAAVQAELRSIAEAATTAIYNARASATAFSQADLDNIKNGLISSVTKNGWMTAALWQRGLSNIYTRLKSLRDDLRIEVNMGNQIGDVFGAGFFSSIFSSNSVSRASFEPVERDFAYLGTFQDYVAKLSLPDPNGATTSQGQDSADELANQYLSETYNYLLTWFQPNVDGGTFEDPFVGYADVGSTMVGFSSGMYVAAGSLKAASDGAGDSVIGLVGGAVATNVVSFGLENIMLLAGYLMAVGMLFMVIIPSVPLIYFLSASITWLMLCIEALFALPVAVLLWLAPAREPSLIGPWHKVVLTMFGLLLRPFFAVIGLIACVIILWIANQLMGIIFGGMLSVMTPDWSGLMTVVMMLGLLGVYALTLTFVSMHAASMITLLGDSVLGWIGVQMSQMSQDRIGGDVAGVGRGQANGLAPSSNILSPATNLARGRGAIFNGGSGNNIKGLLGNGPKSKG